MKQTSFLYAQLVSFPNYLRRRYELWSKKEYPSLFRKKNPLFPPQERLCLLEMLNVFQCSRAQKMSCCILLHIRREGEWEIQVFAAGLGLESLWRGGCAWSLMNWAPPQHPSSSSSGPWRCSWYRSMCRSWGKGNSWHLKKKSCQCSAVPKW